MPVALVYNETQHTVERFENIGMEGDMPEAYDKLLTILDDAVKQQRENTRVMLDADHPSTCSG
ncbi:hypothetical protein [Halomonas llamarensis]|uniref:Uncharacterized protein n=1 Tax=Halomonas llamarensis TaxID=2945104 RepID=A0ABT0SLA0_9GAMM|nr:hypothetical protein [Halomonas llamarensis]MCL7928578.1 hypothetical protein [Halomonas llamarensis]